jgi:hypothetical protein
VARQRNLSQEQIKIRILSYLYSQGTIGANAHTIQFDGIGKPTQEATRFKILLQELRDVGCIEEVPMDHVAIGRVIYIITQKGRDTVQKLRDQFILDILGLKVEDLIPSDP